MLLLDDQLTERELDELVNSRYLTCLEELDLSQQEKLKTDHIRTLANNRTFSRLEKIDLRWTNVSDHCLGDILEGPIGTIRDFPPFRPNINKYETHVRIFAKGTNITRQSGMRKDGFVIEMGPNSPYNIAPIKYASKLVEIHL
jgi:hypothetical protein